MGSIRIRVDWNGYSQEDYLEHSSKTDQQYFNFYALWGRLLAQNAPDAISSVSKLRYLVDTFGADAADEAVNIMLGTETATGLISDYEDKPSWSDNDYWYELFVENVEYMTRNYGPADCREETENCLLGYIWESERNYPQVRAAIDGFCQEFFGMDFASLFAMA